MKGTLAPADELKLYQEILADAAMRDVAVSAGEGGGGTRPAGVVAERAVTDLLARAGRAVYEPFEAAGDRAARGGAGSKTTRPRCSPSRASIPTPRSPPRPPGRRRPVRGRRRPAAGGAGAAAAAVQVPRVARASARRSKRWRATTSRCPTGSRWRRPGSRRARAPQREADQAVEAARRAGAGEHVRSTDAVAALRKQTERDVGAAAAGHEAPAAAAGELAGRQGQEQVPARDAGLGRRGRLRAGRAAAAVRPARPRRRLRGRGRGLRRVGVGQNAAAVHQRRAAAAAPANIAWNGPEPHRVERFGVAVLNGDDGQTMWKARARVAARRSRWSPRRPARVTSSTGGRRRRRRRAEDRATRALHDSSQRAASQCGAADRCRGNGRSIDVAPRRACSRSEPQQVAAAGARRSGPEQITHVRPLSDRVVFCTSTGRIVALDSDEGKGPLAGAPRRARRHAPAGQRRFRRRAARRRRSARATARLRRALRPTDQPPQLQQRQRRGPHPDQRRARGRRHARVDHARPALRQGPLRARRPPDVRGAGAGRRAATTTFLGADGPRPPPDRRRARSSCSATTGRTCAATRCETGKPLRSRAGRAVLRHRRPSGQLAGGDPAGGRKLYVTAARQLKTYDLDRPRLTRRRCPGPRRRRCARAT